MTARLPRFPAPPGFPRGTRIVRAARPASLPRSWAAGHGRLTGISVQGGPRDGGQPRAASATNPGTVVLRAGSIPACHVGSGGRGDTPPNSSRPAACAAGAASRRFVGDDFSFRCCADRASGRASLPSASPRRRLTRGRRTRASRRDGGGRRAHVGRAAQAREPAGAVGVSDRGCSGTTARAPLATAIAPSLWRRRCRR